MAKYFTRTSFSHSFLSLMARKKKEIPVFTLIKPARQCTSIFSGKIPLFSCSLTYSSWLFSAVILKTPSVCSNTTRMRVQTPRSITKFTSLPEEEVPEDPQAHTVVSASAGEWWEHCSLSSHRNTASI